MKTVKKKLQLVCLPVVLSFFGMTGISSYAGTYTNNFEDPTFAGAAATPGTAVITNVYLTNGVLELVAPIGGQGGALDIDDLDLVPIQSFTAAFKLQFGPGSGNPADGFAFVFGPDVGSFSIFSEEGPAVGTSSLCVEFDTYDNGGGEAPAVDVRLFGVEIAHTSFAKSAMLTSKLEDVLIQLNANGTLNVSYKGQAIYTNLALPGWGY